MNKKELERQEKTCQSDSLLKGLCSNFLTKCEEEHKHFIDEGNILDQSHEKPFATRHFIHRTADMHSATEFVNRETMNEAMNSIEHLESVDILAQKICHMSLVVWYRFCFPRSENAIATFTFSHTKLTYRSHYVTRVMHRTSMFTIKWRQ